MLKSDNPVTNSPYRLLQVLADEEGERERGDE